MCGIAGMHGPCAPAEDAVLVRMGELIRHRGPDSLGTFAAPRLACVHTRLSILDLSPGGNQPFRDSHHVLIYNGEIYNYRDLRAELEREGIPVSGSSDTAVLFALLIHKGPDATLSAIRGMFAFAFCDLETETVHLCRDRMGIKPLFWTYRNETLYWASELKALTPILQLEPDPVRTLYAAASIGDHSNTYTVFKGVYHVPPGACLVHQAGREPQVRTYHDLSSVLSEAYYRELSRSSFPEVTERFQHLMSDSVRRMLMSDAGMGSFVSGGIDSALISAIAQQTQPDLQLFTANVEGKYSEFADAQLLARTLGMPLHASVFKPEMLLTELAPATYHYECPIVSHTNALPLAGVARLARTHNVKAVLTGEGSDELFLGYPKLAASAYRPLLRLPVSAIEAVYGLVPPLRNFVFPAPSQSMDGLFRMLVQDFESQRLSENARQRIAYLGQHAGAHYRSVSMLRDGLIALLHRNDRMGMSGSIEARFPFLDDEVVRFGVNLPQKFKIRRSLRMHDWKHPFLVDKAPVRDLARRWLPAALVNKRKLGFPMYGHRHLKVRAGYFTGGYLADIVGLSANGEAYMIEQSQPYFVAKLVSVDVFGRLFALREPIESVTERLLRLCSVSTSNSTSPQTQSA